MFTLFKQYLGPNFTNPAGAPTTLSKYRVVDMFTSCTQEEVKRSILESFTSPKSQLRVVVATISFGMGIDVPDIRQVIHWGPSDSCEEGLSVMVNHVVQFYTTQKMTINFVMRK